VPRPRPALAIAHRGEPIGCLENTLDAFARARELGADMVELDCRLTRDGRVIVLHDPTLERLWGVAKPVADLPWAEVAALRHNGQRVPLLEEALEATVLPMMVDLPDPKAATPALSVVETAGALDRCFFAGSTAGLARIRGRSSAARIALTWDRRELPTRELLQRIRPDWWNPYHHLATPEAVGWAHRCGMGLSVWTVDRRRDIARALAAGVDAVISNQVARAVAEVARRGRKDSPT
jgi:glycerophosphoryl diester phosphodiesterase